MKGGLWLYTNGSVTAQARPGDGGMGTGVGCVG